MSVDEKAGGRRRGGGGERAHHLLARGLELYSAGNLLGALSEWEAALALDPNLAQAQEYIDYVREHFDALSEQFDAAREAELNAAAQGVPVMDVPEDPEAYHSLDVELGSSGSYQPVELADGLAVLDAGLDRVLETPTLPPGTVIDVDVPRRHERYGADAEPGEEEEEPAALEMEAMAPDEDVPGMAPELEAAALDDEPADEDATIDVRTPGARHGLALDGIFDDLPPPGTRPGIVTIQPRAFAVEADDADVLDLEHAGARPLVLDEGAGTTMRHEPPRVRPASPSGEMPSVGDPLLLDDLSAHHEHDDEEATRAYDRRMGSAPGAAGRQTTEKNRTTFSTYEPDELPTSRRHPLRRDDDVETDRTGDYEDTRKTGERAPVRDEAVSTRPLPGVRRDEPSIRPRGDSSVIVDERLLGGGAAGARVDLDRTGDFRPLRSEPGREGHDERVRQRVGELLRQAEEAAGNGDFLKAITAVETAAKDDENGTVAPVLLHRHRDLLYRIYEGHIGDMRAVPLVAVPLHEIANKSLDHRTGFLLSRIDGMLTFEDILDVAGMPRMEAYQILSTLLRKGVIEVR